MSERAQAIPVRDPNRGKPLVANCEDEIYIFWPDGRILMLKKRDEKWRLCVDIVPKREPEPVVAVAIMGASEN